MANTTKIKTVFQFRRATTAEWGANPSVIPAPGEPCFDLTLNTLKIGNGTDFYADLPVIGGTESVSVSADGKSIVLDNDTFQLVGFDAADVGAYAVKGENGLTWVIPEVTVDDLAEELGVPADAEAGTEATGIYAELEAKADVTKVEAIDAKIGEVAEDKTLVQMITEADTALSDRVAIVEGKAHEHVNKTVLDSITEDKVAAWDAAEQNAVDRVLGYLATDEVNTSFDTLKEIAAWIESDATASADLVTRVGNLEKVGAEKNIIASVDTAQFAIDENRNLTLLDIAMGKVAGLQDALDGKANKGTTLAEYGITDAYTKEETLAKIADKITEVNGGESAGEVLGQLNSYKETNDARVDTVEAKLATIEEAAQVNKIETVKVGDTVLEIVGKTVTIPVGAGLKASDEITIADDGTIGIGVISWNKIAQVEGEIVTFDGGGAAD
jgi:hypothetical protein